MPTAANAAYYAEIVAEKATLRRLVEAGTRIVQLGYHGAEGGEVDDIVDRAQAAIYEVTERSTSEDYVALEELLQPTMDEIDAIASRGGVSLGVPTGFADLDAATNGLHPGQMIVVAARPGSGRRWPWTHRCPPRRGGPPWARSRWAISCSARTVGRSRWSPRPRCSPAAPASRSSSLTAR